jgi:hypothetical protein
VQRFIDTAYPATQVFNARTMKPEGPLADRVSVFASCAADFIHGQGRLLDVGANKGYFSRVWANGCPTTALEPDPACAAVCGHVAPEATVVQRGFRDFAPTARYDRIFVGNGPHHLYAEAGGHEWLSKLAALLRPSGLLLLEGPFPGFGMCRDINWPQFEGYYEGLLEEVNRWFVFRATHESPSYTPARGVVLLERKPWPTTVGPLIRKYFNHKHIVPNNEVNTAIAATSPLSNGLTRIEHDGWWEKKDNHTPYRYFENEPELWRLYCTHQIHLARMGYWDIDGATLNFFRGTQQIFDKGGVMPIEAVRWPHVAAYGKMLRQSYRGLPPGVISYTGMAAVTGHARFVEEAYRAAREVAW